MIHIFMAWLGDYPALNLGLQSFYSYARQASAAIFGLICVFVIWVVSCNETPAATAAEGAPSGGSRYSSDTPHFFTGQPQSQSERGNGDGRKRSPTLWFYISQPLNARDYEALARGAFLVIGAIVIVSGAAVFATRSDDQ